MNYEQHVQQNNERLICIKQALQDPSSFVSAAKELLEWCLDPRAFQKPFEDNIIACLSTVSHVAKRDGFDLNLGCRLLSICANYRDKFSPNYAVLLEQWNEELSHTVLLRHQPGSSVSMDNNKMMHKQQSSLMSAGPQDVWSNGPGGAVSVVTTIYSGVSGFSAAASQSYSSANTSLYNNGIPSGSNGYLQNVPSAANVQKSSIYSMDNTYNTYNQDYHQVANGDFNPSAPHAALNAAQVAAAAVATATATATAVALDQSQFQPYHNATQNSAYSTQQYASPVGVVHNQYATSPRMLPPNGIGRPHMPPTYMPPGARTRAAVNGVRYPVSGQKMMAPNNVVAASPQYPGGPVVQPLGPRGYSPYPPPNVMHRPGPSNSYQKYPNVVRSHYVPQPPMMQPNTAYMNDYQNSVPHNAAPGHPSNFQTRMYANNSQFNNMTGVCPGNPTPPMNPSGAGIMSPPRYSSVPHINSGAPVDMKPAVNCQDIDEDDNRVTIVVPNGVIMKPFRLEHNSPVSQHPFYLSEQTYNHLCYYVDYDLQLKCFHQDDKTTACHWPANANVQICINGTPVLLQNSNKSLYIKSQCQPNQNTLQISVQQCSCSHLFVLTLVERPRISALKETLLQKRLLPSEQAMEKIKRCFQNSDVITIDGQKNDMEQMPIKVPLRCPISRRRMDIPARGQLCQHIQCFDLETFLNFNKDRCNWPCPFCKEELRRDTLEIDEYILGIVKKLPDTTIDEVAIDSNAAWKPVRLNFQDNGELIKIKEENNGLCNGTKRFKPDPGLNAYQWTPTSSYANPTTPINFANSPMASPSYCQTNSPLPINSQRQRNNMNSGLQQQAPASVGSFGGVGGGRSSRQSLDSALAQQKSSLVPNGFPQSASTVVQPRSVGNPASVDASLNPLHSSLNGAQPDGSIAGSAPYTPASVSSSGSQNGGPGSIMTNVDSYGNDLYSDLDFLLNDSTTTNSMSLLGDCMDELDMLKYLDNSDGDIGAVAAANNTLSSADQPSSKTSDLVQLQQQQQSQQQTSVRRPNNNNSSLNGRNNNNNNNFVSSNELSALDDVLSNYLN